MRKGLVYKTLLVTLAYFLVHNVNAQRPILLMRDSLDFAKKQSFMEVQGDLFNIMPYNGGYLYVSNQKTKQNKLGVNKVYWVPNLQKLSNSLGDTSKWGKNLNDDFTAIASNDNDILMKYARSKNNKAVYS